MLLRFLIQKNRRTSVSTLKSINQIGGTGFPVVGESKFASHWRSMSSGIQATKRTQQPRGILFCIFLLLYCLALPGISLISALNARSEFTVD